MFACLLGPTTYCKSLPALILRVLRHALIQKGLEDTYQSTVSSLPPRWRWQLLVDLPIQCLEWWRYLHGNLSMLFVFVACMTHGSCHWTIRSLLATAMEATSSTCSLISVYAISTWPAVWAGPACLHHALARPDS